MGWTVLYIAFGFVALWLLGEVLLQYKARLRWRLLAFAGFVGVVFGVLIPSIAVIAVGAVAFAVGQTYVTLSFRRGFSTGWAIGGKPGASRRRKSNSPAGDAEREPSLEVSDLAYGAGTEGSDGTAVFGAVPGAESTSVFDAVQETDGTSVYGAVQETDGTSVYEPQPMPEETGTYGVYNDTLGGGGYDTGGYPGYETPAAPYPGQETYSGQGVYTGVYTDQAGYPGEGAYTGQTAEYTGQGQDGYAGQYDYGTGQQEYASYTDPYPAPNSTLGSNGSGQYDSYGTGQQYADPYAAQQQYGVDTPPGGVWAPQVPQQRDPDGMGPIPQDQPQSYGYDPGHTEQQRY